MGDLFRTMGESIDDGILVIIFGVVALILIIMCFVLRRLLKAQYDSINTKAFRLEYYTLNILYTIFVTIISLFPLLGMLGTVAGLVGIGNMWNENPEIEMDAMKGDFFLALISTAWGIVFSIIFKIVNSFVQPHIEDAIEKARKTLGL